MPLPGVGRRTQRVCAGTQSPSRDRRESPRAPSGRVPTPEEPAGSPAACPPAAGDARSGGVHVSPRGPRSGPPPADPAATHGPPRAGSAARTHLGEPCARPGRTPRPGRAPGRTPDGAGGGLSPRCPPAGRRERPRPSRSLDKRRSPRPDPSPPAAPRGNRAAVGDPGAGTVGNRGGESGALRVAPPAPCPLLSAGGSAPAARSLLAGRVSLESVPGWWELVLFAWRTGTHRRLGADGDRLL